MQPKSTDCSTRNFSAAELVGRIRNGDPEAEAELYRIFSTGVRFLMIRRLRDLNAVDDELHTSFIITIEAIRKGVLRDPERLMGFIRTVAMRRVAEYIEQEVFRRNRMVDATDYLLRDRRAAADQLLEERQREEIAREVLQGMPPNDREVLVRFYLQEQSPERICREMHLTETQYRLLKNRAKNRFAERGQRKITIRPLWQNRPAGELSYAGRAQ
ncbi:MAG: sigma-70 family RNA polymerase sigma factor [Bryobacteraceae bacterium]|jgi:RNA polymerase sigma-70 factor, ECF subfamily